MKIHAIIADDSKPSGWQECFTSCKCDDTPELCRAQVERIVARFNAGLRPKELPRRLISLTLSPLTNAEAFNMGGEAFNSDKSLEDCYFPEGHQCRQDWLNGYKRAELDYVTRHAAEDEDEDEDEDEERIRFF